nr:carbon catabolite repressor protein 4 homolog 1-like [Ipomoea batatas]
MLTVLRVHLPSDIPIVGCELTPYVLLRLPDKSVAIDDVPESAPINGLFLRYKWYRIQSDKKITICSVHPSEQATLQCLGCVNAKIPVAKSYHCSALLSVLQIHEAETNIPVGHVSTILTTRVIPHLSPSRVIRPLSPTPRRLISVREDDESGEGSGKVTNELTGRAGKEEKVDTMDTTNVEPEYDAESAKSAKPTKKRKNKSEDEVGMNGQENMSVDDKTEQLTKSDVMHNGVPIGMVPRADELSENGPKLKKSKKRSEGERLNEFKDSSPSDDLKDVKQDDISKDLPATTGENKLPTNTQMNENFAIALDKGGPNVESSGGRTLSNGLTIEDLSMGEADGKVATPGRKVKVYYTGMLRENGQVFDSNIGKTPYKFRLGDHQISDGWNIGLEGMHVGGKRRLTVPPSMGYGSQGGGESIPPNSWLVYEIQLFSNPSGGPRPALRVSLEIGMCYFTKCPLCCYPADRSTDKPSFVPPLQAGLGQNGFNRSNAAPHLRAVSDLQHFKRASLSRAGRRSCKLTGPAEMDSAFSRLYNVGDLVRMDTAARNIQRYAGSTIGNLGSGMPIGITMLGIWYWRRHMLGSIRISKKAMLFWLMLSEEIQYGYML